MIPSPWIALVLAMAAYRITRLAGWDEFPLALRIRRWAIGEEWIYVDDVPAGVEKVEDTGRVDAAEVGLPGKQAVSEVAQVRPAYRRPTLAHLVHCPFCIGFWASVAVYAAWAFVPTQMLYVAAPFAISGFVGLVAKNLDP